MDKSNFPNNLFLSPYRHWIPIYEEMRRASWKFFGKLQKGLWRVVYRLETLAFERVKLRKRRKIPLQSTSPCLYKQFCFFLWFYYTQMTILYSAFCLDIILNRLKNACKYNMFYIIWQIIKQDVILCPCHHQSYLKCY